MDQQIREFFKAERERLDLNQTEVADRGGSKQSTISKIEIEPKYKPSVDVFQKAVRGIGHTMSSFFACIEGTAVPAQVVPDEPPAAPLPETVSVPRKTYDQLLEWFVLSVQENQRQSGADRRHAPNARNVRVGGVDSAARRRHQDQHPAGQTRRKTGNRAAKQRKR